MTFEDSFKKQREKRRDFVEKMLEQFDASDILDEMYKQVSGYPNPSYKESLECEMTYKLQHSGYKVYKNLSLFQGEQVDEFVCQLLPYYNDQQMVIC